MTKKSKDIKLFEVYIEHHTCSIAITPSGKAMFCLDNECIKCINLHECTKKVRVPKISREELDKTKDEYPEKFI